METLLAVVGSQHDDQKIDVLMALQQTPEIGKNIHILVKGICKNSGAAGKTFFRHKVAVAKTLLKQAGPALVLIETDTAVGAVIWIGTVAVGIGITDAENVLFHSRTSWLKDFLYIFLF